MAAKPKALWWDDLGKWLESLGVPQYAQNFREHEVGPQEIPYITEQHLLDMGITSVGDRLRIVDSVQAFLRAQRNRDRRLVIMSFNDWHLLPCMEICIPRYEISEGSIVIRRPSPCICCTFVDNVDISTVTDVKLYVGIISGFFLFRANFWQLTLPLWISAPRARTRNLVASVES